MSLGKSIHSVLSQLSHSLRYPLGSHHSNLSAEDRINYCSLACFLTVKTRTMEKRAAAVEKIQRFCMTINTHHTDGLAGNEFLA